MCGIALSFSFEDSAERAAQRLAAMENVQLHRGPDCQGTGVYSIGRGVLGVGQQRLSIIDLTEAGSQPMVSPCGRYVLTYNGEVYNYRELALELAGDPVLEISTGDTAVVLAALIRWGSAALARFNGMWALALVDLQEQTVLFSRDRLGVKPLYFTRQGKTLIFASEVKAVLAGSMGHRFKINRDAVSRFLLQSLTSATDETFFREVLAFPASSFAKLDLNDESISMEPHKFWRHPFEEPRRAAPASVDDVRKLVLDSVRLRLRSDVPVGVLLSGGLDSSTLLAAAHEVAPDADIKVLSVVSRDPATSEEPFIDLMAKHVGCEPIKVQTDDDPRGLWADMSEAVWHYDHPISSFSNLAHRRLMERSREHGIVVLLTGQGADEQLAGYNKFFYFYLIEAVRKGQLVRAASMLLNSIAKRTVVADFKLSNARRYIPFMRASGGRAWAGPLITDHALAPTGLGASYEEREWLDVARLSLPDLLDTEDRASMSCAREMRTPFLDYRLVEALAQVPVEQKLRKGWTKYILRRAMEGMLPRQITWRRDKKGYTLPGKVWLTGVLRKEVEDVLAQPMESEELGFINREGARKLYADLLSDKPGVRYEDVFSILALEKWVNRFRPYIDGVA